MLNVKTVIKTTGAQKKAHKNHNDTLHLNASRSSQFEWKHQLRPSEGLFHANELERIVACFIIPLAIVLEIIEVSHQHSGTMLIAIHISSPILVTSWRAPIRPNPGTIYSVIESYPGIVIVTRCIKECCFNEVVNRCWFNFHQLGSKVSASCLSIVPGLRIVNELVADTRCVRGPRWSNRKTV